MKPIAWLFFKLSVPDSWVMSKYSLTRSAGKCSFADESVERFRLLWRRTARPGGAALDDDIAQRLKAMRHELQRKHKNVEVSAPAPLGGGWQSVEVKGPSPVLICVRYLLEGEYLCEAELNVASPAMRREAMKVLRTFQPNPSNEWCAYNLQFTIPDTWRPVKGKIFPGSSELEFVKGEDRIQVFSIHPNATDDTLENLIGNLMQPKERIIERTHAHMNGHRAVRIDTCRLSARGFWRRLRRQRDYYTYYGWRCEKRTPPRDYLIRYRRLSHTDDLPKNFRLWCCP